MNPTRPVQCVFYSHVWAVHLLKQAGIGDLDSAVLVELAGQSSLAPAFGAQKKERYGVTGLLLARDCLEKIAAPFKNVPAPLVLAPNPEATIAALESAVSLLATAPAPYKKAVLLVHVNDAPRFGGAYQHVDQFSVLWDVADFPTRAIERLAETLVANHCMSAERWRGFQLCQHPLRQTPDLEQRRSALQAVLAEFPSLAAAA